jgi:hypothetical protein
MNDDGSIAMCGMQMMQSQKWLVKHPPDYAFRHREAVDSERSYVSHHHEQEPGEIDRISTSRKERHLWCE